MAGASVEAVAPGRPLRIVAKFGEDFQSHVARLQCPIHCHRRANSDERHQPFVRVTSRQFRNQPTLPVQSAGVFLRFSISSESVLGKRPSCGDTARAVAVALVRLRDGVAVALAGGRYA